METGRTLDNPKFMKIVRKVNNLLVLETYVKYFNITQMHNAKVLTTYFITEEVCMYVRLFFMFSYIKHIQSLIT